MLVVDELECLLGIVGEFKIPVLVFNFAIIMPEYDGGGSEQFALFSNSLDMLARTEAAFTEIELPIFHFVLGVLWLLLHF